MKYINLEVIKLLKSKRITEQSLTELDTRVAIEVYLREKKVAILQDRENGMEDEIETESKLQQVQSTLPTIVQQVDEYRNSSIDKRSHRSQTLTEKSLKQSLRAVKKDQDEMSIFSQHRSTITVLTGLDSVMNEWQALNQLDLVEEMDRRLERHQRESEKKEKLRQELDMQAKLKSEKKVQLKSENKEFAKTIEANDQALLEKELNALTEKERLMKELTKQRQMHAAIRKNLRLKAEKERKAEELRLIERQKLEEKEQREAQLTLFENRVNRELRNYLEI